MDIKSIPFFNMVKVFLTEHMPLMRHNSTHTIRSYKNAINLFVEYLKSKNIDIKNITFDIITEEEVRNFLRWLETSKKNKYQTINIRLCAIKIFCKFIANRETCFTENYLKILKIEKLKEEIKPIEYIQQKDIDILFSLPDVSKKKGRRDLFLMELMYATAAREDEISKLTIDSFITNNNNVSIKLIGKGNKTRFVPIDDKLYEKLKIYISDFNICKNDPLFNSTIHNKKVPISKSSIYKIINSYSEKLSQKSETSPKSIWPHLLRHSRAMYWYTNGISLDIIAQLLGHSQVETTLIYAYADTEMKRKALEKIDSTDSANNNHELSLLDEEEIIMKLSALR